MSKLPSILRAFTGLPSAFGLAFPVEGRSRGDSEMPPRERSSTSGGRQWTMVVAVVAVRVMRVAADAVVHVVAVRHRLVAGAVDVARLMPAATMVGGAHLGVLARHLDHVLIDMAFVRVVEVTLMQIIDVAPVTDGGVTTPARAGEHGRDGSVRSRSSWGDFLSMSRIRGHCCAVLGRMFDGVAEHRRKCSSARA